MLYITYDDLDKPYMLGIKKKVMEQTSVFGKVFKKAYHTCYESQMMYLMDGSKIIEKAVAVTRKECGQILIRWIEKYKITRAYIRYNLSDMYFLQLLEFLKTHQIRTVLEIPTYPYDKELIHGHRKNEDACFRKRLYKYIDIVATYSYDSEIFGIPCICLENGININSIPISSRKKEDCTINLIAVSSMAPWHGYERILAGMYQYYKEKGVYKFYLRFIGEGQEEGYYKGLTNKYGLQPFVEFCGKVTGKNLDKKFDLSDIAVGSLGMYKIGVSDGSPIKGAEYCARGIPFIIGYNDMRFGEKTEFVMSLPNSDEAVSMNEVIAFYERITTQRQYRESIRSYAENYLSWERIMEPIIDYLNKET